MLWPMYCGSPLFGTSGGIEQEDVSMNEYLKQYIELQKQFLETKGKADSVRALYAFKLPKVIRQKSLNSSKTLRPLCSGQSFL